MTSSTSRRRANPPLSFFSSRRLRALVIVAVVLVAIIGAAVLGWRYAEASKPLTGPIVLVSIDTLRADRLPAYGYRGVATPSLDRLANDGFVFERAYAHSPQTLPSHTSILTGLLPFEHGIRDDVGFTLSDRHATLADLLRGRGFDTGAAVSAPVLRAETGIDRGFSEYDATLPEVPPDASATVVQRDGDKTIAAAEKWLDAQTSARFFYFVHLNEPHTPYSPPARIGAAHPYEGEIAYADELVGRFLEALRRKGLYDQALIIVTSDHGEGLGDHGEQEHGLFLYDEVVHVPLIVKMPGGAESRRVSVPVQHIDLVPTVLDLVRAPASDGLRGRSLRALLEERDTAPLTPPFDARSGGTEQGREAQGIYAESLYGRFLLGAAGVYSLTDERYRFIDAPRPELYDLQADPDERSNLASARPGTVTAMAQERAAHGSSSEETGPDPKDLIAVLEPYRRAIDLLTTRRFAEAIAAFRAIAQERPEIAEVWLRLGEAEIADGRPEDAIASLRRFAQLKPGSPQGPMQVATALFELGRFEDAGRQVVLALDAAPKDDLQLSATIYDLGIRAALARKDEATARRLAANARASHPSLDLGSYVEARVLHTRGDFEQALPLFERALAANEASAITLPEISWYIGDTLTRLDRYDEAEKAFKRELAASPLNVRTYSSLAMLYRASNRDEAAQELVAMLARTVPTAEGRALAERLRVLFGARARF